MNHIITLVEIKENILPNKVKPTTIFFTHPKNLTMTKNWQLNVSVMFI